MVEKARGLCASKAKRDEYGESSKYVDFKGKDGSKVKVSINEDKIKRDKMLAGFNILVTSETDMKDEDIYCIFRMNKAGMKLASVPAILFNDATSTVFSTASIS